MRVAIEEQDDGGLVVARVGGIGTMRQQARAQLARMREVTAGDDLVAALEARRCVTLGGARLVVELDDQGVAHPAPPPLPDAGPGRRRRLPGRLATLALLALLTIAPARAETPCEAYFNACIASAKAVLLADLPRIGVLLAWQVYVEHLQTCYRGEATCRSWGL